MTKPRISLYVRLSRAADAANLSLEGMERDLRALAARLGAEVLEPVHVDDGLSGGIRNRPEFQAWLADAREGRASILASWSIDRMTREGVSGGGADILDVLEAHPNVRLLDTQGTDSTTPGFRLGFVVKAEVAREELQAMRRRALARAERSRAAGQWSNGVAPYGYRITRRDGKPFLTVAPDEAGHIVEAAQRVVAGEPLARVVRDWNASGVPCRKKSANWTSTSLLRVLTGPSVRGYATHKGQVMRGADGLPRQLWEPVLTPELAAQVETALVPQAGRGRKPGSRSDARLLSGLLRCSGCGRTLRAGKNANATVYRCCAPEGQCPARASVNAAKAEQWAEAELMTEFVRSLQETRPVADLSAVDIERRQVEEAIQAVLAEVATDATPELFERLRGLQGRLAALQAHSSQPAEWRHELTGRTIGDAWDESDVAQRRDLLANAITLDHIVVRPCGRNFHAPIGDRMDPVWREDISLAELGHRLPPADLVG